MALGTRSRPVTRYADGHTRHALFTGYKLIALHLCLPEFIAWQISESFHLAVQPDSLVVCRLSSDQRRRKLDASDPQVRHRCKRISALDVCIWPVAQSRRGRASVGGRLHANRTRCGIEPPDAHAHSEHLSQVAQKADSLA